MQDSKARNEAPIASFGMGPGLGAISVCGRMNSGDLFGGEWVYYSAETLDLPRGYRHRCRFFQGLPEGTGSENELSMAIRRSPSLYSVDPWLDSPASAVRSATKTVVRFPEGIRTSTIRERFG